MKSLTVLFDSDCALCRRCRSWLAQQPAFIPLRFLPYQSAAVQCQFPGLEKFQPERQLVCVSDTGAVYVGDRAWLMCLYALREYRVWSARLAHPALQPMARRICQLVSENRLVLSRWLRTALDRGATDQEIRAAVQRWPDPATEACALQPPPLPRA